MLTKCIFRFFLVCLLFASFAAPQSFAQGDSFLPIITVTNATRQLEIIPQPPQQEINISAVVSNVSPFSPLTVRLFYRIAGFDFQSVFMQSNSDSLWSGIIPSFDVVAPYVEYYVRVDDGFTYGTDPVFQPEDNPYRIPIRESNPNQRPPAIELTPHTARLIDPTHAEYMHQDIPVSALVEFDNTAWSKSVTLFWRQAGQTEFFSTDMTDTGSNIWQAVLPDSAVRYPFLEFYILAADNNATSTDPAAVPQARPYVVHVLSLSPNMRPPFVKLTERTQNKLSQYLPSNTAIPIDVFVIDDVNRQPHAVTLAFRHADRLYYKHVSMQQVNDSLWTGDILAGDVLKPGVHFYVTAYFNDTSVSAPSTINPDMAGRDNPYFISVFTRNQPPVIRRTEATKKLGDSPLHRHQPVRIEVIVTDIIFPYLDSVHLYYRLVEDRIFQHIEMRALSDSLFAANINTLFVTPPGLEYYIYATDTDLESFDPDKLTWPDSLYHIRVDTMLYNEPPIIQRTAETIALSDTAQLNREPLTITATIIDTVGHSLKRATLVYRHSVEGSFVEVEMQPVSADTWQRTIPADAVTDPGIEYFITADDGVDQAFEAEGTPASQYPFFIPVMPPNPPPVIFHEPVASAQPDSAIRIVAQVIDTTRSVALVQLVVWNAQRSDTLKMGQFEIGNYTATIPGDMVVKPYLSYRILARDNWGYTSQTDVYTVAVGTAGTVLPNPFTPNQDGFNDLVTFNVPGLLNGAGSISIYNQHGRRIREISDHNTWDGTNDDGDALPPGVYLYAVTINGKVKVSGTLTLIR